MTIKIKFAMYSVLYCVNYFLLLGMIISYGHYYFRPGFCRNLLMVVWPVDSAFSPLLDHQMRYQLLDWVMLKGMVDVDDSSPQADWELESVGLVWRSAAFWCCSSCRFVNKWTRSQWWECCKHCPWYYYYKLLPLLLRWMLCDLVGLSVLRSVCFWYHWNLALWLVLPMGRTG